jgi:hypothetical protein
MSTGRIKDGFDFADRTGVGHSLRLIAAIACGFTAAAAQDQAQRPADGWPCVAGRTIDPAYLNLAEDTGGFLFLFQKGETGKSGPLLSSTFTHPSAILRGVGQLTGTREFEFLVDPTIESLFIAVSMQCKQAIAVISPTGSEVTPGNASLSDELSAGRLVRVDQPQQGRWQLRVAGQGLLVVLVLAKTELRVTEVTPVPESSKVTVHLTEGVHQPVYWLADAAGGRIARLDPGESSETSAVLEVPADTGRYRILVEATDAEGHPVQRMWAPLLGRKP